MQTTRTGGEKRGRPGGGWGFDEAIIIPKDQSRGSSRVVQPWTTPWMDGTKRFQNEESGWDGQRSRRIGAHRIIVLVVLVVWCHCVLVDDGDVLLCRGHHRGSWCWRSAAAYPTSWQQRMVSHNHRRAMHIQAVCGRQPAGVPPRVDAAGDGSSGSSQHLCIA